ncbi:hypothetical protein TanjilG_26548 [Lupinus angustifolius]|uniref:F-box domain-containing protein n=2 Tax=Lupinus angustifolius TaxID=3871 RepID=A0A4P1QPL2_LUPAN|nr:hypothetical protein TanjilG_26548 [Lupinus angustifolius]
MEQIEMLEAVSNECEMTWKLQWSTLPHDLLSQIIDRLGLIEFLSFHGVCKDWRIASMRSSPEEKSRDLWFLIYGEGSNCSLLSKQDKLYNIELPELVGATCLASYKGWLLLFCNGAMFFFSPFSRAKIDVPNCPITELSDHVAAFSCDPTSQNCIIAVISRTSDEELELHMLFKGSSQWSKCNFSCDKPNLNTIRGAMFHNGEFNFLDRFEGLVTFDACKNKEWNSYRLVKNDKSVKNVLDYYIQRDYCVVKDIKRKMELEDNVSITTCGTFHLRGKHNILVPGETIEAAEGSESTNNLKGVWIQPRYFHIEPNQSW